MKILFVDYQVNTKEMGGSMYSLDTLLRMLNERGIISDVFTLYSHLNKVKNPTYNIIENQKYYNNRFFAHFSLFYFLNKLHKKYDIIHIYDPTLLTPSIIFKKYKQRKISAKMIGNLNSYFFCTNYSLINENCYKYCNLKKRILHSNYSYLLKILTIPFRIYQQYGIININYMDGFTADSEFIKYVHKGIGVKRPIEVIYEFINFELLKGNAFICKQNSKDKFKIIYVGRLEKNKGVDILLYAIANVKKEYKKNIEVGIIGKGTEEEYLKNLCKTLNLNNNVIFYGYIPFHKLYKLYSMADLFIHPGRWPEPFGRTIVEAMYFGLPIIVSDVGAPPLYSNQAVLTFKRNDYKDLAKKIEIIYKNEKIRKMLSKNVKKTVKKFYPEKLVKKLIRFYEKILVMK